MSGVTKFPDELYFGGSLTCHVTRDALQKLWKDELTDDERVEITSLIQQSCVCSYDSWYKIVSPNIQRWKSKVRRRLWLASTEG